MHILRPGEEGHGKERHPPSLEHVRSLVLPGQCPTGPQLGE